MLTKSQPNGDLGGRRSPTDQATPEGGGSKVTVDPQGNPVSIRTGIMPEPWNNIKIVVAPIKNGVLHCKITNFLESFEAK
jgi:hypothetical protein